MSNHPKIDFHKDIVASALYGWAECTVTILSLGYLRPTWRMKYACRDVKRKFDQQRQFVKEASNAF